MSMLNIAIAGSSGRMERALLEAVPSPTEDEVRDALAGLCRCTGYARPTAAVLAAAARAAESGR